MNSRQGAGILYGLSAMLFQPEGGKKERKKDQWFFVLISRMLATSCTSRLTHARAWEGEREREEDSSFSFLDLSLHSPDDK